MRKRTDGDCRARLRTQADWLHIIREVCGARSFEPGLSDFEFF